MKNYCKIMLMCMQLTVLLGMDQLGAPSKEGRRRSPVRPPEKTNTTTNRSNPIPLTRSAEIRFEREAKKACSPSSVSVISTSPMDYLSIFAREGNSPSPYDYSAR